MRKVICILILAGVPLMGACNTATYEVGSGKTYTTTADAAAALAAACGTAPFAGTQTILMYAGTYPVINLWAGTVFQPTAINYLLVKAAPGNAVVVDCGGTGTMNPWPYQTTDGLEIQNCTYGYFPDTGADHTVIKNCKIHGNTYNIFVRGTYAAIVDNEIYGGAAKQVTLDASATGSTVTGNYIHDTAGVTVWGVLNSATGVEIAYNLMANLGSDSGGGDAMLAGTVSLHDNVFVNPGWYDYVQGGGVTDFYNNIWVSPYHEGPLFAHGGGGTAIRNTIILGVVGYNTEGVTYENMLTGVASGKNNLTFAAAADTVGVRFVDASPEGITSTYNTYYFAAGAYSGRWDIYYYSTLATLQAASGMEANSRVVTALFQGTPSLTTVTRDTSMSVTDQVKSLQRAYIPHVSLWCGGTDDGETAGAIQFCAAGKAMLGATI